MQLIRKPKECRQFITTLAIGEDYIADWERAVLPNWLQYCERHDLGLILFDNELIEKDNIAWKKSNWQRLLIPSYVKENNLNISDMCYLDVDVLLSPIAENIFEYHDTERVGVVSQRHNLPMNLELTLRMLAFSRNQFLSSEYPLDSALFMEPRQIFKEHGFENSYNDYFCSGVLLFNVDIYADIFEKWFYNYPRDVVTMTGGGEEPIINYELLTLNKINVLKYEFQALWIYEIASKYPFLFKELDNEGLVRKCIESSLLANNFLHFAGSWHECQVWKYGKFFQDSDINNFVKKFREYMTLPLTGKKQGVIRPDLKVAISGK